MLNAVSCKEANGFDCTQVSHQSGRPLIRAFSDDKSLFIISDFAVLIEK